MKMQQYANNGVKVSKTAIKEGDEIVLSYNGFLAKNGASNVYAHIGYGDSWENIDNIPMKLDKGIFKANLKIKSSNNLNICFKDDFDNWDNNSHNNYSFKVSAKATKTASKTTKSSGTATSKATSKAASKTTSKTASATKKASAKKSGSK